MGILIFLVVKTVAFMGTAVYPRFKVFSVFSFFSVVKKHRLYGSYAFTML